MRRCTRWILAATTLALSPLLAGAQAFPSKPMKILVPFTAGSGADSSSRFYGEQLSKLLNQTVTVENKPGGSGVIAVQAVRQLPADGHTILMGSNSPAVVNAITIKNLPYDPFKDLRPLYGLAISPVAFAVKADSPYKTIGDVVAAARKENRPLQLGNYSAGYQLVAAWLGTASGLPVTHIPYKGGAQMLTDVIGGALEVGVIDFTGTIELLKGGKLRVLAITAPARDAKFPDIPTMKESGFADFETSVWSAFFMRAETPDDVVEKLAAAIQKIMTSDVGKAYHASLPSQPMMMGPKALGEFQLREYQRFKRVADTAGIKPE
ncbi:Bug family tripartite tricarboxylate transporter substrate binding protein [Pseudaquabacterium pictum]|uniref:ABC transporter substrate-binding protein n=1 Tax=Pseudaquabacterium pictum TaxID=2315236 RepID=A0A480AQ83_9BURK|nr:tripartite tricarboxylate transporter substrate binding protein [Rubrivivax pictus]GCL63769.1 ABC transporter substrate-binding protein [Rubrivivax pictus]